ncbi:MAG: TylF/MycF family methyltransferase [Gammaproteobacteria bacterium]|nr:TylF/MycF family methyltransferase [Gammaproteobacteria bacterium]MCW8924528.1 TylF/MycF family methyltransferase [Gammaproteobacteria bacterium]
MRKVVKLFTNPAKYLPILTNRIQKRLCSFFQDTPFFMQGQMDINPKSAWHSEDFRKLTGGYYPKDDHSVREIFNLEPWDNTRRDMLTLLLRTLLDKNIKGDIVELGVYKGLTAKLIHHYMPERKLHLFDTFEGFSERSVVAENNNTGHKISGKHFSDTSLDAVKSYISQKNNNISFYKGYFPETIPENFGDIEFAFVHLDADLYEPIFEALKFFYSRMVKNGMIMVHDYNAWPGARKAVDDFFSDKNELPIPMPDKSGSVLVVKQ